MNVKSRADRKILLGKKHRGADDGPILNIYFQLAVVTRIVHSSSWTKFSSSPQQHRKTAKHRPPPRIDIQTMFMSGLLRNLSSLACALQTSVDGK